MRRNNPVITAATERIPAGGKVSDRNGGKRIAQIDDRGGSLQGNEYLRPHLAPLREVVRYSRAESGEQEVLLRGRDQE